MDGDVIKKGGVFKDRFTGHDSIDACELQTIVEILNCADSSVCKDRDIDGLFDLFDDFPVGRADKVFFVFSTTSSLKLFITLNWSG